MAAGDYHVRRTTEWLEGLGYDVEKTEKYQRIVKKDPETGELSTLYLKRDVFGADLVAKNGERMIWVQVKQNPGDISKGMKQLAQGQWPPHVERWVVYWPLRRLMRIGPDIHPVVMEEPCQRKKERSSTASSSSA